jgi:hypothetical protein
VVQVPILHECLSWGKSVKQLKTIFNLDTLDLSHVQFSKEMSTYYSGKLMNQLIHIRNNETGKLSLQIRL